MEELDQKKEHGLRVQTETDEFYLSGRPCELSSFSFVPVSRDDPPERTAFNSRKPDNPNGTYDRLFRKEIGYNNKLHRDDREHAKSRGLEVNNEDNPNGTYDRLFRKEIGYNNKLHRDDREHAKSRGLEVNNEEKIKAVPTLASSEYGHRLDQFVDHPDRKHVRIAHVRTEFYRRNGIPTS